MEKTIKKDKVDEFLKSIAASGTKVYGPVEKDNVTLFRPLDGEKPYLDFGNSNKPPKETFFPQSETMFNFKTEGSQIVAIEDPKSGDSSFLLFGIRPCDARAMVVLDSLFGWDYNDPYYQNRKNRTTIISLGCTQDYMPLKNCFCTSMGGNPISTDGSDIIFIDIGDDYYVKTLTEKGDEFIQKGGAVFQNADPNAKAKADAAGNNTASNIVRNVTLEGTHETLKATFDDEYWEGFAKRCLGCGICTLLCPTCHCFDINDVQSRGKAVRERGWDSCQYPHYSIHASGHNPRPAKRHRQRNRIYHKFLYSESNLDLHGCVGCGRCITHCPVNIDIIEVVEGAKEAIK
jgi:ferredoxin